MGDENLTSGGPGPTPEIRLILAGLGGQGVVFLTRLLAQTAVSLGLPVIVSESHGMSRRGGSVVSHLKISGENQAALIGRGTADALLALEPDEAIRRLTYVRRGGVTFVNSEDGLRPEVTDHLDRLNIQVLTLPATNLAIELGSPATTNVVLAGFAAAHPVISLPIDALQETIRTTAPWAMALNLKALKAGYLAGQAALAA